jgi:hypothetical protein
MMRLLADSSGVPEKAREVCTTTFAFRLVYDLGYGRRDSAGRQTSDKEVEESQRDRE